MSNNIGMNTFQAFIEWMHGPGKAAQALGVSRTTVWRIATGRQDCSKQLALKVESISGGIFKAPEVMFNGADKGSHG